MAITQAICNSFREELLDSVHNFNAGGDTFKLALFTSSANLGPSTTSYNGQTGEAVGTNYVAGGVVLVNQVTTLSSTVAFVDFSDATWSNSSITARGALLYNNTKQNRAVLVLDFLTDRVSSNSLFAVRFPTPSSTEAIIKLT